MTAARPRPSAPDRVCPVPGCGCILTHQAKSGYCKKHWRWGKAGAVRHCTVPGCNGSAGPHSTLSVCRAHRHKVGYCNCRTCGGAGRVAPTADFAPLPVVPVLDHWHHARACRMLWQHVIQQAFVDATDGLPADRPNREARAWLTRGGRSFQEACQGAGYDAEFIRDRWRRVAAGGEAAIDAFGARLRAASPTTRAAHPDFYGKDAA